jgi:indolepyruvate ferredoxin oxidoreductase beta subunit
MKKPDWFRMIVCGVGGQGVLLASRILCEAAMRSDLPVVSGEVRNMAQRGGTVIATVALGGARSTIIPRGGADAILGFEPMETARMSEYIGSDTLVITNTRSVVPFTLSVQGKPYPPLESLLAPVREKCGKLVTLDATQIAVETGSARALNMVMLGALAAHSPLPIENAIIEKIIAENSPEKLAELNIAAFRAEAGNASPTANPENR